MAYPLNGVTFPQEASSAPEQALNEFVTAQRQAQHSTQIVFSERKAGVVPDAVWLAAEGAGLYYVCTMYVCMC